jgi:hypothetical protein
MRRREFISIIGSVMAQPFAAGAQQQALPVIGFLSLRGAGGSDDLLAAFRNGLREAGFVEGQNVAIEYRWAEGQHDRLPALAGDLVRRQVNVIFANTSLVPAQVAKAATATIPIVFEAGADPVRLGLVESLNRPGGNVTGVTMFSGVVLSKRLGLLREITPDNRPSPCCSIRPARMRRSIRRTSRPRRASWDWRFICYRWPKRPTSIRRSQNCLNVAPVRFWSAVIHSSILNAIASWRLPRSTWCRRSMRGVFSSKQAG